MANSPHVGAADVNSGASQFDALAFIAQQFINKICTMKVVQIVTVYPGAGLLPDTVDVNPLVNQIDGLGNATPHGIIHGLPVWMMYGAESAVKITPAVNDIGLCIVSDRDISSVKVNAAPSNPGSRRVFDLADGVYLGGILNAAATQSILMNNLGITMTSPTAVTINVGGLLWSFTSAGLTLSNGLIVEPHVHGGVTTGSGNTGGMIG